MRPDQTKTGDEQLCYGGAEGWDLAKRLARQARSRGVRFLVTWPGLKAPRHNRDNLPATGFNWQPLKSIRNAFGRTAKVAGITAPRRFHDLRAAYISEVASTEKSGKRIQLVARHKSFTTTERYIALANPDQRGTLDRVEQARGRKLIRENGDKPTGGFRRPTVRGKR